MGKIFKYLAILAPLAEAIDRLSKGGGPGEVAELRPSFKGMKFSIHIERIS